MALLWSAAAWHKFSDARRFATALTDYQLLPPTLARPAAALVPWVEAALALGLLLPPTRAMAAALGALLLLAYGAAMAINLARGRADIECGCGAYKGEMIGWWLVGRNVVLAGASLLLLVPGTSHAMHIGDVMLALAGSAILCGLYISVTSILRERQASHRETD